MDARPAGNREADAPESAGHPGKTGNSEVRRRSALTIC
jgi:hypothetical protein